MQETHEGGISHFMSFSGTCLLIFFHIFFLSHSLQHLFISQLLSATVCISKPNCLVFIVPIKTGRTHCFFLCSVLSSTLSTLSCSFHFKTVCLIYCPMLLHFKKKLFHFITWLLQSYVHV
jgi:hypothetical protein